MRAMVRRLAINLRIEGELLDELERIRDADGVPVSEQIRRGIRLWLKSKGAETVHKKTASRRVGARRKA